VTCLKPEGPMFRASLSAQWPVSIELFIARLQITEQDGPIAVGSNVCRGGAILQ